MVVRKAAALAAVMVAAAALAVVAMVAAAPEVRLGSRRSRTWVTVLRRNQYCESHSV